MTALALSTASLSPPSTSAEPHAWRRHGRTLAHSSAETRVAQLPHFVFSPNTLLSVIGLIRGRGTVAPAPAEDWRNASVAVVIPALNEQENIIRCLASVLRQTIRPHKIVVVDDGSSDATAARALAFCEFHGLDVLVVKRVNSIGKTPTLKDQARALDSDVLFVLDADTLLESDNYLERTVQELYQGVDIASAWGSVLPLREKDRRAAYESTEVRAFLEAFRSCRPAPQKSWVRRLASAITNTYREVLYLFLQRFVLRGQMAAFGTVSNPAGCAVAYRREYLVTLFDAVEPLLGDDLTNSEDIFIGLAMLNEGYRNVQVLDVYARTVEPEVQRLPKQIYLWSSAFLQSAFYFDALLKSPFKVLKRWRIGHGLTGGSGGSGGGLEPALASAGSIAYAGASGMPPNALLALDITNALPSGWVRAGAGARAASDVGERRRIQAPDRNAFGHQHTRTYGRPVGWVLLSSAVEKIGLPTVLLMMVAFGNWEGLIITIVAETILTVTALVVVMQGRRLEFFIKGIAVTPIRYALVAAELVTIARFASDVWLTRDRRWRK
jgi:glycosyltransferase involved in cell wall biosynthesis